MTRTLPSRWLTLILAACLAGCATPGPEAPAPSSTAADNSNTALIVFSLSRDPDNGGTSDAIVILDGSSLGGLLGTFSSGQQFHSTTLSLGHLSPDPSDFDNVEGHLYVLRVPVGDHVFTGWKVFSTGSRFEPERAPPPLRFNVAKGEVRYLGSFHAELFREKNQSHFYETSSASVFVGDTHERDLALFYKRYPQYTDKVVSTIFGKGPWLTTPQIKGTKDSQDGPGGPKGHGP